MQAENLSDIQAVLQVLSSSAWHFAITVVILAALIALLLEATGDFGLRRWPHERVLRETLEVSELAKVGIDHAMLRLPSDELAAQLAAIAGAPAPLAADSTFDGPTLRGLLLKSGTAPLASPAMTLESEQQLQAMYLDRQIDRLQVLLRASYRRLESTLAITMGALVVFLAMSTLKPASTQAAIASMFVAVLVPLASALLAPMLREMLRNAIRRI